MLKSISHIALVVKDPGRTAALFRDLFDARMVERDDQEGHHETFVKLAGAWIVLVGASVERTRTGDHIAFQATPEIIEATVAKLQKIGREFVRSRSNRALYFSDYDEHVFELSTEDLDEEIGGWKAALAYEAALAATYLCSPRALRRYRFSSPQWGHLSTMSWSSDSDTADFSPACATAVPMTNPHDLFLQSQPE